MFDLEFAFFAEGDALKFRINGEDRTLFDRVNGEIEPEENLRSDGNRVYFGDRRAGRFGSDVLHYGVVDAKEL